jgi:hypothetical protein
MEIKIFDEQGMKELILGITIIVGASIILGLWKGLPFIVKRLNNYIKSRKNQCHYCNHFVPFWFARAKPIYENLFIKNPTEQEKRQHLHHYDIKCFKCCELEIKYPKWWNFISYRLRAGKYFKEIDDWNEFDKSEDSRIWAEIKNEKDKEYENK